MQIPSGSPDEAGRLLDLGVRLAGQRRIHEAIQIWQTVLELDPAHVQAYQNLGAAFSQLGQLDQAKSFLRRALELKPDQPEAYFNLANIVWKSAGEEQGHKAEAISLLRQALQIRPAFIEAQYKLGSVLIESGNYEEAASILVQAAHSQPLHPLAASICNQLGVARTALFRYDQAEEAYQAALRLRPDFAEAYSNLGNLVQEQGRLPEAIAYYERSIAINSRPITHFNLALARLQSGDFENGWPGYEWRWHLKERPAVFQAPRWDGGPLADRTIYIYPEQGLGDTIQFVRFLPLVRDRGATVLFTCPPEFEPLLGQCQGIDQFISDGSPIPPFDVQAPLMSLPWLLGITLQSIPADVPYLTIDPKAGGSWRDQIRNVEGFKIGIVWQGDFRNPKDRSRSIPQAEFLPLARIPGVRLVSLQNGPGADQLQTIQNPHDVLRPSPELEPEASSLIETAAVIQGLDLVISIDSGIAHLAGGLGIPVWVALSTIGDWRWLTDREDSPWYPTVRLFRQKAPGNWGEVFQKMKDELEKLAVDKSAWKPFC